MKCGFDNLKECNETCRYFSTCTRCAYEDKETMKTMADCDLIQSYKIRPKLSNKKCTGFKIKGSESPFFNCQICAAFDGSGKDGTVYGK